jgi:hypothetical protein
MKADIRDINKVQRNTSMLTYTRRNFLKIMGLGTAAGIAAPVLPAWAQKATTKKKWRMRLSTSSIHFMQLPIEQACERIAKLGFEAIDIWSAHEGCPHLDDVAKRLGPDGLKKLLAKHKLKLFAFSVYQGGYKRYAELLGKAGGGVAIQGSAGPCKPEELTARMRQFIEGLKPLVELAEKYNSYLEHFAEVRHCTGAVSHPDAQGLGAGGDSHLRQAAFLLLRLAALSWRKAASGHRPDGYDAVDTSSRGHSIPRIRQSLYARTFES